MREWKKQIDYDTLIHKNITVLTWKYWYLPFIKKEITKIISATGTNKQKSHDAVQYRIKNDLQEILLNEIPTIYDEVDCMFQFLALKLQHRILSYSEMDLVRYEFINLRSLRNNTKNPTLQRTIGMKKLVLKFYTLRYVPTMGN
jgi:hypothetical protein